MSLKSELDEVLGRMPAAVGVAIMDRDGLMVEKAMRETEGDLEGAFVELAAAWTHLSASLGEMDTGGLDEMAITTGRRRYFFRRITPSYFLVLATTPAGLAGEGSWRLRKAAAATLPEFAD